MSKVSLRIFNIILKATLGVWLKATYNIKFDISRIDNLKPPYILISNHCLNWDPFTLPLKIKETVHWMASDNLFRSKTIGFLLTHLVGAFPKKKAVADMSSIKTSIKIIRSKGIVGVFPEGNRTWDGKQIDTLYSTAKFVKMLKVPVVMCEQRGCYLSRPRWAVKGRRGQMSLNYYILMQGDDLKLSLDEIHEKINNAVKYNESDWQLEHMIEFKGKANAEFLEQYLYVCPKCKSISTLHSQKHSFFCEKCGLTTHLNNYGFFEGNEKYFDDVNQWGEWQRSFIGEYIDHNHFIFKDENVLMKVEDSNKKLTKGIYGTLILYKDKIQFDSKDGTLFFENINIIGNTIQLNWIFEFYYNGKFQRFYFYPKNRVSAYKWTEAVDYIKRIGGNHE
ncbi:MAG: 1-acyl-sn-glycerol-3-phosphate acyltransferase [Clostridia bacterium]|nr:1-acyl-sn-glycerol-3-phosphate acyltransferase [Clostridia bacterium]